MAHLRLADAVDATEALLKAVRVPRQVVVHHQVRPLQIDALARRIGGQQHPHHGVVLERFLCLQPRVAAHAAVDEDHRLVVAQERDDAVLQVVQRVPVLGKEDQLLAACRDGWRQLASPHDGADARA